MSATVHRSGREEITLRLGDVERGQTENAKAKRRVNRVEGPEYSIAWSLDIDAHVRQVRAREAEWGFVPFGPEDLRRKQIMVALVRAVEWYIRRAQRLGADPISHFLMRGGWLPQDAALPGKFSLRAEPLPSTFSGKMDDQKAAEILSFCGLIPRRKKTGPKETLPEMSKRFLSLIDFDTTLDLARWLNRNAPRELKDAEEIARAWKAREPSITEHELRACGIVARHRASSSKKDSLTALVAAHVFGLESSAALHRLEALRKSEKRRTNSVGRISKRPLT